MMHASLGPNLKTLPCPPREPISIIVKTLEQNIGWHLLYFNGDTNLTVKEAP